MTALPAQAALAQSALDAHEFRSEQLQLSERPGAALLRVHSLRDLPGEDGAVADWPGRTGACTPGDPAILCLRPREWLLLSERHEPSALSARLDSVVDPAATALYDLSDGLTLFRLSGQAAPWLLAKVSGLDFLTGGASPAHCARTRMGQIAVVIHYRGPQSDEFDLIVDRSLARYLWEVLVDAAPHAEELARSGWTAAGGAA